MTHLYIVPFFFTSVVQKTDLHLSPAGIYIMNPTLLGPLERLLTNRTRHLYKFLDVNIGLTLCVNSHR